jgi:hypothetical protein
MSIIDQINDLCETFKDDTKSIYCVNDYDIIPFVKLYMNCKLISSATVHDGSGGVTITSISPETWFDKLLPYLVNNVRIVTNSRSFILFSFSEKGISSTSHECNSMRFESDEKIVDFLTLERNEDLVLYYICKYVDLSTLQPQWLISYYLVKDPKAIRNRKINSIL